MRQKKKLEAEWVLLSAGNGRIALHKTGSGYLVGAINKRSGNGNTKIVFETAEDIFKLRAGLVANDVQIMEIKTI